MQCPIFLEKVIFTNCNINKNIYEIMIPIFILKIIVFHTSELLNNELKVTNVYGMMSRRVWTYITSKQDNILD